MASNFRSLVTCAIFCAAVFLTLSLVSHAQPQQPHRPNASVVVLKNGQVMTGMVTREAEKVALKLPTGSRIVLNQNQVQFVASSLGEAYWELSARTKPTDLPGHTKVFQWCLRHELFDEAANHLLVLQDSKISARRLAALDFDLQTKKKHADRRAEQQLALQREAEQLAKMRAEKAQRKERIESLIGAQTVSIPDLNRVPLRPIITPVSNAVETPKLATVAQATVPSVPIDHDGNPVPAQPIGQVGYHQPIFSTPAVATVDTAATAPKSHRMQSTAIDFKPTGKSSISSPAVHRLPADELTNTRRIPRPTKLGSAKTLKLGVERGFSVKRAAPLPNNRPVPDSADPFDSNYFNKHYAAPK